MSNPTDVDFDEWCDPNNPRLVPFEDISAAAYRIRGGVYKTPCFPSHLSDKCNMRIFLKCEFLQFTGSFKERGARNALLQIDAEARKRGVITASSGNHSQGMSYHGVNLKIPTTVVMPTIAPIMKISKCQKFGANVVVHGPTLAEAKHHAMVLCKEKGLKYINGYDHPHIIAGAGTVALEILEQVPDVEAVLVPCGGGGLLAGVAIAIKHLRPDCFVYGIETDKSASMAASLKGGKPVFFDVSSTIADGLAVSVPGVNSFVNCKKYVDKMITVSEDWTSRGILCMAEMEKYIVEGAGATGIATVMAGLVNELQGKTVVCVATGGNIDTTMLSRCLDRGMAAECRLVKFKVNVSDRPGSLSELCKTIGSIGVSIKDITQERAWLKGNIFYVRVKVVCETRGPDHLDQLREIISKDYKEVFFPRKGRVSLTESLEDVSKKS